MQGMVTLKGKAVLCLPWLNDHMQKNSPSLLLVYTSSGIRSIRSQGRPTPGFCRTTRSHYKPHELCKTSDYSMYMYYYHMYHLYYSS